MVKSGDVFDVIVIGSGISGLCTAGLLTKMYGQKVLVLEQHNVIGGLTHEFKRKNKFKFDVGLHYVGESFATGNYARNILNFLSNSKIEWARIPDPFESFVYSDLVFSVSSNPKTYLNDLISHFPQESRLLKLYFRDIRKAVLWYTFSQSIEIMPRWVQPALKWILAKFGRLIFLTTKQYFEVRGMSQKLSGFLTTQWGDYGVPPSQSSFGIHAMIVNHFLRGGLYPKGGSGEIARHLVPEIEANGGVVLSEHSVSQILIDKNSAIGVKTNGMLIYGKKVVSTIGSVPTYTKLLSDVCTEQMKREIAEIGEGLSAVTLYMGFRSSPAQAGVGAGNYWISSSYEHDKSVCTFSDQKMEIPYWFFSCASLRDPKAKSHTAQAIAWIPYSTFSKWKEKPWGKRDRSYYYYKNAIIHAFMERIEKQFPGISELIEFKDLSTPLTIHHFQQSPNGWLYGVPSTPSKFKYQWIQGRSPIRNLYLGGADSVCIGIAGAMLSAPKVLSLMKGPLVFPWILVKLNFLSWIRRIRVSATLKSKEFRPMRVSES